MRRKKGVSFRDLRPNRALNGGFDLGLGSGRYAGITSVNDHDHHVKLTYSFLNIIFGLYLFTGSRQYFGPI